MNTVETLKAAKNIISKPEHWQQEDYTNDDQTCFCGLGAIAKVLGLIEGDVWEIFDKSLAPHWLEKAARKLDPVMGDDYTFAVFNDAPNRSHEEVLKAFDLAIALAQEETE